MNEIVKYDKEYTSWNQEIGNRFKRSQIKAASSVYREMLLFYLGIREDIVELHNETSVVNHFIKK